MDEEMLTLQGFGIYSHLLVWFQLQDGDKKTSLRLQYETTLTNGRPPSGYVHLIYTVCLGTVRRAPLVGQRATAEQVQIIRGNIWSQTN